MSPPREGLGHGPAVQVPAFSGEHVRMSRRFLRDEGSAHEAPHLTLVTVLSLSLMIALLSIVAMAVVPCCGLRAAIRPRPQCRDVVRLYSLKVLSRPFLP
jgi:hypothetical protein